jgi:hypothetical protein
VELSSQQTEHPTFKAPDVTAPTELVFHAKISGGLRKQRTEMTVLVVPAAAQAHATASVIASPGEEVRLSIDSSIVADIESQPVWTALLDPELWLEAAGQIFFSLSVGFGIVLNYASYLRKDDDVALSGLTASATNQFCEVCLGGLITVPVAFLFLGAAGMTKDVLGSEMALGFHALPAVFNRMPAGQFFGTLWFSMLFMAAITSSLSMLQPAIAFLEEGFDLGRRASVTFLGLIVTIGTLVVVYFSKNLRALDTMNFWIGTVGIFILATIQVIIVGWVFGIDRAREEVKRGAELHVPGFFWFIIKYVCPLYLLTIFVSWCYNNVPKKVEEIANLPAEDQHAVILTLVFLGAVMAFFAILIYLAGRRWAEQDAFRESIQESAI